MEKILFFSPLYRQAFFYFPPHKIYFICVFFFSFFPAFLTKFSLSLLLQCYFLYFLSTSCFCLFVPFWLRYFKLSLAIKGKKDKTGTHTHTHTHKREWNENKGNKISKQKNTYRCFSIEMPQVVILGVSLKQGMQPFPRAASPLVYISINFQTPAGGIRL